MPPAHALAGPPSPPHDLLWRCTEAPAYNAPAPVHADVTILMINPELQGPERRTQVVTPANWLAQIVEIADPLDGLVRAAEMQPDMLIIDLATPTFDVAEVLCAVKRSRYFKDRTSLAVATDLDGDAIPGHTAWPDDVLLLRRRDWLAALHCH